MYRLTEKQQQQQKIGNHHLPWPQLCQFKKTENREKANNRRGYSV